VNALNKTLIFLAAGLRGWMVGAAFAIGAFSVAGVPPAAGYLGKLTLFRAALTWDGVIGAVTLVALVFLGGAISFVYSFQVYQRVYLRPSKTKYEPSPVSARLLVVAMGALLIAIGLYPEPLLYFSERAAAVLTGGAG
jgi:multicomponent Na+:H+ antiporter subunit D